MSQHIGIVACSAEGAALCYRTICVEGAELLGRHDHPEVSMHTYSLARYMKPIYRDDWDAVGELMLASAEKLASLGADFVICPDNTIHQALPHIESRLPVPWLHIADIVAEQAVRRGFRRVGLTGRTSAEDLERAVRDRWKVDGDFGEVLRACERARTDPDLPASEALKLTRSLNDYAAALSLFGGAGKETPR